MGGKDGVDGRLIPACAGKTTSPAKSGPSRWAHPRVCGENLKHAGELMPFEGSSPRVRGKPVYVGDHRAREGLIPACAGKTVALAITLDSAGAHPRVCGENVNLHSAGLWLAGSSPRVRGKPWGDHARP